MPAVCEEVAFRGFILSGLERRHRTRSAILLSALLFGFLHVLLSLFQQLFNATLLGLVLGLLAVRSRSIVPGIVFHFINNAWACGAGPDRAGRGSRLVGWLYRNPTRAFIMASGSRLGVLPLVRAAHCLWKTEAGAGRRRPRRARGPSARWIASRCDLSQPGMTRG